MSKQSNYHPQLTGLRAIAAYLVYLYHFPIAPLGYLFEQLHIGVGIFFVLSGFLIYYRYAHSFTGTKQWWKIYILNRFARIYPLYLILTILALGYSSASLFEWFAHLTLLRGFFSEIILTGIEPAWSLSVEECFYLSAPFLFLAFQRGKFWQPLFLIYAIGILLTLIGQRINFYGFFSDFVFTVISTYFGRALEFFLGMYLARKFLALQSSPIPSVAMPQKGATILGVCGIMSLILLQIWLETNLGIDRWHPLSMLLNNLAFPICNVLLIWGLLTEATVLSRFLASPLMGLLGKSSYAFYLTHTGIISIVVLYISSLIISNSYLVLLLHFIFINLISIGLFHYIEEPINNLIRSRYIPKKAD